jgi:glutamyl-tRNA synthetase
MGRIRTRFAPSPTGFLHIGGLRTALFSWLFARNSGGAFVLRIEDTDRSRLVEGALDDIIDSLRWVSIDWDEGPDIGGPYAPYLQSERKAIYREHADSLLKTGHAYRCFCSPQRLQSVREQSGRGYDLHCRSLSSEEIRQHKESGDSFVIRLKVSTSGETAFVDEIRGTITTKNDLIDDFVLLKSDGFPTYHLANVVDDHLMKIGHVIRGEEWISSTPKHILLYQAFGWEPPAFAHVPVILNEGGGKLSKRHGATMVREFRAQGYLPDALVNFIALLGWSLDDKTELFSMQELIHSFDLDRVNRSSCIFSYEKLDWFNGIYIRSKTPEELYSLLLPYLVKERIVPTEEPERYREYILEIIPLIRERLKHLGDIREHIFFFFDDLYESPKRDLLIPKKLQRADAARVLAESCSAVQMIEPFEYEEIEKALRELVETLGYKTGQVFMTIRVAVTGTTVSPGLFETMMVLGKERVLRRLCSSLKLLESSDIGEYV